MSKNKQEVSHARFRLNATLQDLVEKKEDGLSDDEIPGSQSEVMLREPASPVLSSSKRSSLSRPSSRKRKRKDDPDGIETDQYQHKYVMKLFDRSVDLAQFEENTPLYPICRAWMRNQPQKRDLSCLRSPSPDPDPNSGLSDDEVTNGRMQNVYRMPSPLTLKVEVEDGRDLRIPSPIPQMDDTLDINADPDRAPPPEQLLLNHMARWKLTRQKWRIACRQNEIRFAPSMNLLRDMFEQQCKKNLS
ncbi:protein lin-37 homolog [Liolophura sinensis]|uniref:protein lin-37 homolog n=1 Tax=Liolophura sinensis TaxID=3198878 RepID=UPI003158E18E